MKSDKKRGSPKGLPQPAEIELTRKNLPLRIILLVMAIILAIGAFGYGIASLLNSQPGWNEIKCASGNVNCSQDFVLNYYLGNAGISASTENKKLSTLYTKLAEDGYRLFYNEYTAEGYHNIAYVNQHVNEDITVEPALYKALSQIVSARNRAIFMAPIYVEYQRIFTAQSDPEAGQYDPTRNPELMAYITELCGFSSNPDMIDIQILGDNRLRLNVSQAYLAYARENEITEYLDFGWMTNAFIADYIADALIENGHTNGYLTSYDGFTRNLYSGEEQLSLNLFQREGNDILMPAVLQYQGRMSLVSLRDFPISDRDSWHYYAFADGRIASSMLDPATGREASAVSSMICYSKNAGCGEILLAMMPAYMSETLDTAALNALKDRQIFAMYPQGQKVYANDPNADIRILDANVYTRESF
ncbi:MAG: hypothetical protein E7439_01035 [Ruminococcaceae bacterium]|nr:hypothetical protein [Oscillospiraceae bacterium]